jgi:hypothetical protein
VKFRVAAAAALALFVICPAPVEAYYVTYKEQYYRLYHIHYMQDPDDTMENIYWLEKALAANFCNPLWALAKIENEIQWEKYRYLFMMHINLKLIEQYVYLGNKWNKRNAYFYNAPFREQNLESLETAERCYRTALYYWRDAVEWAQRASESRFRFVSMEKVQYWEDEAYRILVEQSLDYEKILNRELRLLRNVRERFQAMDENTYSILP